VKLLDTTIAIDHLRGDHRATELLERLTVEGELLLASELIRFELLTGLRPDGLEPTELFMGALTWVPVDEAIARMAGSLAAACRRSHSGIDAVDY
jgi:predicted nucleic acid-binding protein